jgi:hypothetical protein
LAQIDNGRDAGFLELGQTFGRRLRAAEKYITDSADVANAVECEFLRGRIYSDGIVRRMARVCGPSACARVEDEGHAETGNNQGDALRPKKEQAGLLSLSFYFTLRAENLGAK